MGDPVIIAARRSAIGRTGGLFRYRNTAQLAAPVLAATLADGGLSPDDLDEIILGNVLQGGNAARACALEAGLPLSLPAVTVDRQCASGLEAILQACWKIKAGGARAILAGGVESTSTSPWRVERPATPLDPPRFAAQAPFSGGSHGDPTMVEGAEAVAQARTVPRDRQDQYAAKSHEKALAAQSCGRFDAELIPVFGPGEQDEGPRPGLTLARLGRLKPLLPGGTVTVGNACATNDAAAAVLVVDARLARDLRAIRGLRFLNGAAGGVDPALPGLGAIPAARRLDLSRLASVEFNEAFASQTLACLDALGLPEEIVCPGGGALALGHPYGASGAILVTRLFHDLGHMDPGQRGLALLSAAGGLGLATLFETLSLA
ncbi:MAG: thiolase family protein [Rhodospirillum sp.]|nr:thiolase family protein [Rhodospirillum sp.]MCF8487946.1 thiolase family protein [Rhodospirillum sp.]MCF8499293.1 thiolase family protein [Rhodospirillum sp.]